MICKNCGTKFNTGNPDKDGIVTCPECGKRYRKASATSGLAGKQTEKPAARTKTKKTAQSGFERFMRYKIGGMLPAWFVFLTLAIVAVIMIVALSNSGGNIEGSWRLVNVEAGYSDDYDDFIQSIEYMKESGGELSFTFEGGRFTMNVNIGSQSMTPFEGSYRTGGGTLYLTMDGETEDIDYSVSGNTLTLQDDGQKVIFQKK